MVNLSAVFGGDSHSPDAIQEMAYTLIKNKIEEQEHIEQETWDNLCDLVNNQTWEDADLQFRAKQLLKELRFLVI